MSVNFNYNVTRVAVTAYFYKPERQSFGFVTIPKLYNIFGRITYDEYKFNTSIDKYAQTNKFYTPQTYNLFNNTTTKIYDEIAIHEFPAIDFNIYQNYQYNFQTTQNINLPAIANSDVFVVEDFAQTLSQKTFSDDTTFQQDIDVVDVRATGNIGCVDLTGTGNITASGKLITNTIEDTTQVQTLINGNQRFNVTNTVTRLREEAGSVVDTFADANNCYMDFQTAGTQDYDVRFQIKKTSNTVGSGYFNIQGNTILQNGYLAINFKDGQSLPNVVIYTIPFTTNTLPTGFTKNDIGGGYSSTITNNSGYDRTLVMGGNMSLNGGGGGFLLFFVGTLSGSSTVRLFTFQAPIVNGSTSVTGSFTFQVSNGQTIFFNAYQSSGATQTIKNDTLRRSRVYGQVL
jgi:hypothetical protein